MPGIKKTALIIALLFVSSETTFAIDTPFNFLRYVKSARAAGLSGAFMTVTDDPTAVFFNPATLSTVETKQASATFLKHVLDINSGNLNYVHKLNGTGTIGANIGFTSYGSFEYADYNGNRTGGTFGANDLSIGVSYSDELDSNFYYGVTLKYIYVGIEQVSTSAMAVDAGLLYKLPDGRTNLGVSVLHAGTQLSQISNQKESLPLDLRMGVNHRLRGLPLLFNFTFHHLADDNESFFDKFKSFTIGGEFYFGEVLQVRLGYDNQVRLLTSAESDKGLTGFSGGLGFVFDDFNFDYGFSRYGSNANLHRFSVSLNVNNLIN
ncbi:MAG: PorV/PorQ family protein [Candidatus Kapaibacterium sp.]|jgi:long-subunit fatty acid transport protein|nr:PorV/PorQ family protein [Candidatus Kapabacteria bacterium]